MPKGYAYAEFEVTDAGQWETYVPLARPVSQDLARALLWGVAIPKCLRVISVVAA